MKKSILFLFFSIVAYSVTAQVVADVYVIQFTDKNNSQYSTDKPEAFLSEKAIQRRLRQHIPVDVSDLPVNTSYINEVQAQGITVRNRLKWMNAIVVSCDNADKIAFVTSLPFVAGVKKIEIVAAHQVISKFEAESHSKPVTSAETMTEPVRSVFNYGYSYNQAHQIHVDCLHDMGYQGQGITIAVLDAGFLNVDVLPVFDSLRNDNRLLGTWDFVAGDAMVYDDFFHGMNVLSCMAGNLPGQLVGTAPKADYWLLRTEDANSETLIEEYYWLAGAEFADSVGADVINSSLGYNYFDNSADSHTFQDMDGNTTVITNAADWAASKGIVVVSSAGNAGGGPWFKITAPADADSVLTVGAVDSLGNIAGLSSRGPTSDGRIKPNTVARGLDAVVAANMGGVAYQSGTSFSSPITAGAVACLWQANSAATNMELLNAIQQSASKFTNPDTVMGYGIPDFCAANIVLAGIKTYNSKQERIVVYPNPVEDELYINVYSGKKQPAAICIMDMLGREYSRMDKTLSATGDNTYTINTSQLVKGMYVICIAVSGKKYYEKIIKQ